MKKYSFLLALGIAFIGWQSVNAAILQPTLKTTPTFEIKPTEKIVLPTLIDEEEAEDSPEMEVIPLPDIKFEVEDSEVVEPEEDAVKLDIVPLEIKAEADIEIKSEVEMKVPEATLEIKEIPEIPEIEPIEPQEDADETIPEFEAIIEPIEILKEADKYGNLTSEMTEEDDGTLKYKLKTVENYPIYKSDASGNEDIISLAPKKEIKFSPATKSFLVEAKEEYDYADLLEKEEDFSMGFEMKQEDKDYSSKITATPQDDCLQISFNENSANKVSLCEDFTLKEDGLYLPGKSEDEDILLPPFDIFYDEVKGQFKEQEAEMLDIKLIADESGKPHYEMTIEEDRKLFWLIPVTIQAKVSMGIEDNQFSELEYGLISGFIFSERDYLSNIKILPDLVITAVEMTPKTLHMGDKMTMALTIKNTGLKWSAASFTSEGGPSYLALYFGENQALEIDGDESGFFLDPGETTTHYFHWNAIMCNIPVNVVLDTNNRIEESHEENNIWNGVVKCLPNDAPDLVVSSVTFANGMKKIGQPTKLNYTIKNQGSQPSPAFNSYFKWGGAYFSNLDVPAIPAGQSHTGSFTYTPQNCSGAVLHLDASDTILETDEDNNLGYEPDSGCSKRPDLFVDFVWWKANGITAGDIHAGEQLWFQVKVKNDPENHSTLNSACINSFNAAVKLNGTTINTLNFGNIGCVPANSYSVPDYWIEKAAFVYVPECNGEHLTVEIDPNNAIPESLENNNSWTFDVVCTLPPPVVD